MAGASNRFSARKRIVIAVSVYWAAYWTSRFIAAIESNAENDAEGYVPYLIRAHDALNIGFGGPAVVALLALAWWVYRGFKPAVASVTQPDAPRR